MNFGNKRIPDFIANLSYWTAEEGGRQGPAFPGYRPQFQFSFSKHQTSGQQIFLDKEIVFPGESVKAEITLFAPQVFKNSLETGQKFVFKEGWRIIGSGEIVEVLNKDLKKTTPEQD